MICNTDWSKTCCRPLTDASRIHICRVAPSRNTIGVEVYCAVPDGDCALFVRKRGTESWSEPLAVCRGGVTATDLDEHTEYEFFAACGAEKSAVGIARTGDVPGTVVNYLHPEDTRYAFSGQHLCTPSLLRHPDGYLLASMDVFGRRTPQNLTLIFRSDDGGKTWYHLTELFPCFWGKLFYHRGAVWMLATSTEYGDLLIGRSDDGGKTWGTPTVLARGSSHWQYPGWHKSAMPVISHGGRLWTGIDYGSWSCGGHRSALLSAKEDADLLRAESWHITPPLAYDPTWQGSVEGDCRGFLEGNAVVLPDGGIADILRYTTDRGTPNHGLVPILRGNAGDPDQSLTFDRYVPFPGNLSKFDILFDGVSGYYYSVINRICDGGQPAARNLLSLMRSVDLTAWDVVADLLDYRHDDAQTVGFQYVSFLFDGDDLLFLSRTAWNGAKSYHDNNYITFHRVPNFRTLKNKGESTL